MISIQQNQTYDRREECSSIPDSALDDVRTLTTPSTNVGHYKKSTISECTQDFSPLGNDTLNASRRESRVIKRLSIEISKSVISDFQKEGVEIIGISGSNENHSEIG